MGSQLVAKGKTTVRQIDYRIFNIDNTYTVYIQIGNRPSSENSDVKEPIFAAVGSFPSLKLAQEYISKH